MCVSYKGTVSVPLAQKRIHVLTALPPSLRALSDPFSRVSRVFTWQTCG
jgi:hypothetical protein